MKVKWHEHLYRADDIIEVEKSKLKNEQDNRLFVRCFICGKYISIEHTGKPLDFKFKYQ